MRALSWLVLAVVFAPMSAAPMSAAPMSAVPPSQAAEMAAATVCAVFCDTRDPSLAGQELFPVGEKNMNGRRIVLHVSNVDGMAWGSIDNGVTGDAVWLDRSWDGGATWDGLLGKASIPGTWTGTRTLMYNLSDPSRHRRGVVRACGDAHGVTCTDWVYRAVCITACDGAGPSSGTGDHRPVPDTILSGRRIGVHMDDAGMAWGTIDSGRPGDEVWLDRSWDAGAGWPGGSLLGRVWVPANATAARTPKFHTADPGQKLYGGAIRACGRNIEGQQISCTAWARPTANRAAAAADALMWSYDPFTAWWPSSWWNSAVALTTVIDWMKQTGRRDYLWIVNRTFEVNRVPFAPGERSSDQVDGHFISRSIDDSAWWALAWIRAYDLTGDVTYLNEAVTIANYVAGFWDGVCGGGVWWNRERTYKNAVTNGQYIRLTAALHNRIAGDSQWLAKATAAWQWFTASGMVNPSWLVNDGLTSTCQNNGQPVWTYNQGLAIGAAVELWRATGDGGLLTTARRLADAGTTALVTAGILTERCDLPTPTCDDNAKQFKGIFMRYLAELNGVTAGAYQTFARTQADTLWSAARDSLNRLGQRWSAGSSNVYDWRTQASGLSALLAAEAGPSLRTGPIVGYGGKCVDVAGAGTADGTAIQLWTCNNSGAQRWTVGTDGTLRALGKCMDVRFSGTANGTLIQLWTCNGTGAQVWQALPGGALRNPNSGRCLDATGWSSADGTRLQIWDCHGGANQVWQLPV